MRSPGGEDLWKAVMCQRIVVWTLRHSEVIVEMFLGLPGPSSHNPCCGTRHIVAKVLRWRLADWQDAIHQIRQHMLHVAMGMRPSITHRNRHCRRSLRWQPIGCGDVQPHVVTTCCRWDPLMQSSDCGDVPRIDRRPSIQATHVADATL